MKWHRIEGFLYRHWLEIKASLDRKGDVFFFPIIDILVFGFLSVYVSKSQGHPGLAAGILAGMVFWTLLYNLQRDMSFSLLDDVWSRNIFNLYASPLQLSEILTATLLLSLMKTLLTSVVVVLIASGLFHLALFSLGSQLFWILIELFVFGWSFGFFTTGIILRYGTKAQALAWSLVLVLYPFAGVIYPLAVMPTFMQKIAMFIPVSYIFEGLRQFFQGGAGLSIQEIFVMTCLNIIYLVCAILFYVRSHKQAKGRGWFVHPT